MKKILAVSGGVDSMVMLDMMIKKFHKEELVVATFDHGTRESAENDAEFVERVASSLGIQVRYGEAKLGAGASEDLARQKRYEFLRQIADREKGEIFTAHHLDDLVESVAINLIRGTGFRGLAVLNTPRIRRPFIESEFEKVFDKRDILKYATENNIVFRQDPTNTSELYLRNCIRPRVFAMTREQKMQIFELWERQKKIASNIDETIDKMLPDDLIFQRAWFKELDEDAAMELLRAGLNKVGVSVTRPQILDFLKAILGYKPGKRFNLPGNRLVKIGTHSFQLEA